MDARIKYEIGIILGLNIYPMFSKLSWIGLIETKFEFNSIIMGLVILIYTCLVGIRSKKKSCPFMRLSFISLFFIYTYRN